MENIIFFPKGKVKRRIKEFVSRYAKIIIYEDEEGTWVQKLLLPWYFKEFSNDIIRRSKAKEINDVTLFLKNGLRYLEFPVVRGYRVHITQNGYPVHLAPYKGDDCEILLKENPKMAAEVIAKMVISVKGLLTQQEPWQFSPDLRISNFCLDDEGTVFFDVFPPLCRTPRGDYWVNYPNPEKEFIESEISRKFTLFGAIRRLRFFFVSSGKVEWEEIFEEQLLKNLPIHVAYKIKNSLDSLPDKVVQDLSRSKLERYIKNLPRDEDIIREVAARIVPNNLYNRKEVLSMIFRLSSKYPDSELTDTWENRFGKAKILLLSILKKEKGL